MYKDLTGNVGEKVQGKLFPGMDWSVEKEDKTCSIVFSRNFKSEKVIGNLIFPEISHCD